MIIYALHCLTLVMFLPPSRIQSCATCRFLLLTAAIPQKRTISYKEPRIIWEIKTVTMYAVEFHIFNSNPKNFM